MLPSKSIDNVKFHLTKLRNNVCRSCSPRTEETLSQNETIHSVTGLRSEEAGAVSLNENRYQQSSSNIFVRLTWDIRLSSLNWVKVSIEKDDFKVKNLNLKKDEKAAVEFLSYFYCISLIFGMCKVIDFLNALDKVHWEQCF